MNLNPESEIRTGEEPDAYSEATKPNVINSIVTMEQAQRAEFKRNYSGFRRITAKYRLARDLILDGRFPDQRFLLDDFNLFDKPNGPKDRNGKKIEIPEEERDLVQSLKDRLHFLLIQKDILPPESMDQDTSERLLRGELRRRQDYQDLIADGFPVEVIGQLMTVDLFSNVSGARKLEEYRSWVTKSLYREFMGVLSGKTPRRELTPADIMARIPARIFSDPEHIKYHLTRHYIEERLMRSITDAGIQEGLATLEQMLAGTQDEDKKTFLGSIVDRFYDIATEPDDPQFNSTIDVNGQPKHFPSFEQMAACYDFGHYGTRLVTAGTGLGKTGTAFKMEAIGARKIMAKGKTPYSLVLVPASGRETWPTEERKLFKQSGNVKVITGAADIEDAIKERKRFTVVSYELLGRTKSDPELARQLERLVETIGMNGAIADEIDGISNYKNGSTQMAEKLIEKIRQNYAAATGESTFDTPIIGLTATPIRSSLSDLNVPMALLYPERYAISHGKSTATRKTFSDTHVNRPDLAYFALVGERRMFRWEQAAGVQGFEFEPVEVEISPFEELLYCFIANKVPMGPLDSLRILEDCVNNPLLVKAEVRSLARKRAKQTGEDLFKPVDIDQTLNTLVRTLEEWKKLKGISEPIDEGDFLNTDRLVELGLGELVLDCFFSELLENGVDTLVEGLTRERGNPHLEELRKFWRLRDISTKYASLRKLTQESLQWVTEPDGRITRQKVWIVSPARRQGRTGDVLQKQVLDENDERVDLYADGELDGVNDSKLINHLRDWVQDFCDPSQVLLIDGTVNVGRPRDSVIARWVNNPGTAALLTTLEATYQSRDYTLQTMTDTFGRSINGVRKILLGPPWHNQQLQQMAGRDRRQGQRIPVDLKILIASGLIDQGKAEAVMYTYLLSRMALSGIVLSSEQQAFFDSKRVGSRIAVQTPEARFLKDTFAWVRGAGEDRLREYFRKQSTFAEITHDRLIAEKFYDGGRDAYKLTGYNAELEAYLTRSLVARDSRILSLGAGTLLFQRKLGRGIDNVDLNRHMMEAGWAEASQYDGRLIEEAMSSLNEEEFPSGNYKLVESAFALDWSNLSDSATDSERVRILAQINRLLAQDGYLVLTLPEKSLDDRRFNAWIETLEKHFGLQVDKDHSGKSFGRSRMGVAKRLGWCIVAKKVGNINLEGLTLKNLEFANDNGEWISTRPKKKKKGTSGIQGRDYPTPGLQIEFDQYEIINNNQERVIILDHDGSEIPVESEDVLNSDSEEGGNGHTPIPKEELLDQDYLRGDAEEDYIDYRESLLKPARRATGLSWEENEQLCVDVFQQIQQKGKKITSRLDAFSSIIREIRKQRRMATRNGKGVN